MKKILTIALVVVIALVVIIGGIYAYKSINDKLAKVSDEQDQKLIGGERDEHGCLGPAGYSWCEIKQKCLRIWEEYCGPQENEVVFNLLKDLKSKVEVSSSNEFENSFDNPTDLIFKWFIQGKDKVDELQILGLGITVFKTTDVTSNGIKDYFKDNGFEVDKYNILAGTVGWATGYSKDDIACAVPEIMSEFNPDNPNYQEPAEARPIPQAPEILDISVKCGLLSKSWQTYTNEKYGYSLNYPLPCLFGPLPGECKQKPPEQRAEECLCFLNGENPDSVSLQTFIGEKDNLTLATISVSHYSTDFYNPPAGRDLIDWLKEKASYQDIPDEINMELDGIPAVRIYTPQSPQAYSQENVYFISKDKLFNIYMIDVDNQANRALYNLMLGSLEFVKE